MRLSRLTKILTVALAAVLLGACGGNSGGSGGSQSSPGGPVTLTWFMWSGSDVERNAWLHVADLVTQKYPNIKIQFETTPFDDYWTKLTTQAASRTTPCVIGLQGQRAPQFGNLLVPLDDYRARPVSRPPTTCPVSPRTFSLKASRSHCPTTSARS